MDKLIAYVQHVYISVILHVTEKICLWGKSSLHMSKWAVQFILMQFNLTYSTWQNKILCQSAISTKTKQKRSKQADLQGSSLLCTFIKNQRWQTDECFFIHREKSRISTFMKMWVVVACTKVFVTMLACHGWFVVCFYWFLAQCYVVLEAQINGYIDDYKDGRRDERWIGRYIWS